MIKWYHIVIAVIVFLLGIHVGSDSGDEVIKTVYQDVPVPYRVDSIIYQKDTLILPNEAIDTNAVVEEYFRRRTFDTNFVVNEVELSVGGTVFENELKNLDFSISNLRATEIYKQPKWTLSGGAVAGRNVFAPTISTQFANHEVGLGYNLIGDGGVLLSYKYTFYVP